MNDIVNSNWEITESDVKKIREDYDRALEILKDVKDFNVRFGEAKRLLNDPNDGIDANSETVRKKKQEIDVLYIQSQGIVSQITENLEKVRVQIGSMQTAYNDFSEIKGKVSGKSGEIEQIVESAKGLKNDVEKVKTNTEATFETIKSLLAGAQQKIQNMQGAYESFVEIKGKVEDPNTWLQVILNTAQDLQKKSKELFQEIQSFRDESQKLLTNIKNNAEDSSGLKNKTQEIFEVSRRFADEKTDEIRKITALITETGFSNAFQKQEQALNKVTYIWLWVFFVSIMILTFVLYKLFIGQNGQGTTTILQFGITEILYRFSLTSPLLFIISVAISQYSKNKDLADRYAFKAATAGTIKHHVMFLRENFTDNEDEVVVFATDTLTKIYKEPYNHNDDLKAIKKLEEKIENLKNWEKEKVDIQGIIESAKELRALFTDEGLLKKILEFFSKFLSK